MNKNLESYKKIIGKEEIERIKKKAAKLKGKHIVNISSTYQGGGVAEILNNIIFLFNNQGIQVGWRILHGNDRFFSITKKFHNGLQGAQIKLSNANKQTYYDTNKQYSVYTHIVHDLVVVHDPQPLAIIDFYKKVQPWVFRCHVDLTNPNPEVWNFLKKFIKKYDHMIVSKQEYKQNINIKQSIIHPAIDPLSNKNKPLQKDIVEKILTKYKIKKNKPIISQISRFDKWKDPLGVIKVFEQVRAKKDCQLILLGSFATDDPEGLKIFEKVKSTAENSKYKKDIKIITADDSLLVNCLQRFSDVVIQKSKKEGFGLTVAEALYKETPVVSSHVGGIPLQIIDNENGFLSKPTNNKAFTDKILYLLNNPKIRQEMGKKGKEHIKKNFLITRLFEDYIDLFTEYLINDNKKKQSKK